MSRDNIVNCERGCGRLVNTIWNPRAIEHACSKCKADDYRRKLAEANAKPCSVATCPRGTTREAWARGERLCPGHLRILQRDGELVLAGNWKVVVQEAA